MQEGSREDFRVGGCVVRPRLNRVETPGGRTVQVQPKIMDVLVLLAARAGEVVTREELLRTVWAGTHVTEHVLARAVSELRKLFGDSAQRPRVIETIPKVGYRLVAPVSAAAREENPKPETTTAAPPASSTAGAHPADADAAPPSTRLEDLRRWAGLAALTSATALLLVIIYLLATSRHLGPWHFNH